MTDGEPKQTPAGSTVNARRTNLPLRRGATSPSRCTSAPNRARASPRRPALATAHRGTRTSPVALAVRGFANRQPCPQRPENKAEAEKPLAPALGPIPGSAVADGRPSAGLAGMLVFYPREQPVSR